MTNFVRKVIQQLEWVITVAISVVVSILGLLAIAPEDIVLSATLLILATFAVGAIRDRSATHELQQIVKNLPLQIVDTFAAESPTRELQVMGLDQVLLSTIHFNWIDEIRRSREVTIAKLKLNFTEDPDYFAAFESVLNNGGKVRLILSDPRSPALWLRHMEEPHTTQNSETAWTTGPGALAAEVAHLNAWRSRLSDFIFNGNLYIGLAQNYPTQAFYCFDDKVYSFSYPYMVRGFHAPAFIFKGPNSPLAQFMRDCCELVVADSVELTDGIANDVIQKYNSGRLSASTVDRSELRIIRKRRASNESGN